MATRTKPPTFFQEISAAIQYFQAFGFTSQAELDRWVARIRRSALLTLQSPEKTERELRQALGDRYKHLVTKATVLQSMPEVSRMTLNRVKPKLRKELDRRILASANLISLNRQEAIDSTLRRFQGWATAIQPGGTRAPAEKADKTLIRKSLAKIQFTERRVIIDQSHKLVAAIRDIVAVDGGAIAGRWHSPWRRAGYSYRLEHKERDELVYAIRGNWALGKGLMKAGPNGYLDSIDGPGFKPFCSCSVQYIFSLSNLPSEMLTKSGIFVLPEKSTAPKS